MEIVYVLAVVINQAMNNRFIKQEWLQIIGIQTTSKGFLLWFQLENVHAKNLHALRNIVSAITQV